MTKKEELVWRLGKLPSVEEVTTLISNKIITQEEAREILFNTRTVEERDKNSLEAEIKFLRELVDKLSNRQQIIETFRTIEVQKPNYPTQPWFKPYEVWCGNTQAVNTINSFFKDIQTF